MHGILFKSMKDFIIEVYGDETWIRICKAAGIEERIFLTIDTYDDEKLFDIIEAAVAHVGTSSTNLLKSYGQFTAGRFLETHYEIVRDGWGALDLIANVEEQIHAVLRERNPNLDPPELACRRSGEREVRVVYRSNRKLCFVAKGIIHGIGDHYGVQLSVTEEVCMHDGAEYCELVVSRES